MWIRERYCLPFYRTVFEKDIILIIDICGVVVKPSNYFSVADNHIWKNKINIIIFVLVSVNWKQIKAKGELMAAKKSEDKKAVKWIITFN
jgi:hypothetical protein